MAHHSDSRGIDPGAHRVFADLSRVAVLETLRRSGRPLAVREIAEEVGLHANTVRAHLAILTDRGYVLSSVEDRERPGRPRLLYSAANVDSDAVRNYRLLAETLVSYLSAQGGDHAAAAIAAGRGYGERFARESGTNHDTDAANAIEVIVRLLDEAGFKPRRSPDDSHIDLHRCPFRELAEANPEIVCGVHLGIMRGALDEMGAPVEARRLRPFAEPDRCIAELGPGNDDSQ
ncbi:helix-turn-helix transcriptional regulator [Salinactinospora qingdaonensis]|uniref:Helix-turn-helix domain-containing protein n=1 Tax=Salinactinospora qingdaonensis TaxID=702744 RepID=A0ABP7FU97_9ACTN